MSEPRNARERPFPLEAWRKPGVEFLNHEATTTVVVAGREIRGVTAFHASDGSVTFCVGDGGCFTCDSTDADHIARLIATALAVGAGYVSWPDADGEFVRSPFAPRVHMIGSVETDDGPVT